MFGEAIGGVTGLIGVSDTNKANRAIAHERNIMEQVEAQKARQFSAHQASLARSQQGSMFGANLRFQERMSNTAVQRRMQDLKAAGINPLLAGKMDATTPSGSSIGSTAGASAKANAHGYTAQNKLQGLLDNLTSISLTKKAAEEARGATAEANLKENKDNMTKPPAKAGEWLSQGMSKAESVAKDSWSWIKNQTSGKEGTLLNKLDKKIDEAAAKVYKLGENPTNKHGRWSDIEQGNNTNAKENKHNIWWLRN